VFLGELHVPKDRPVIIELSSKDVIHNFALPHMRSAQDAIPGQIIPMWFKPVKTGTFEVVCGQLCGYGHYSMKGSLVVDEPAEYQAWLKEQASLAATPTAPAPSDRPPGEPPVGPTPGTVPPPGAPKTANPSGAPDAKPGEPPKAPSPSPHGQ
jgi:heme/copper-type cytochrome/quinol oxidase subunit 2